MAQISGYVVVNVTGLASAGTVSAPGLKAGDRIIQTSSPSINGNVNILRQSFQSTTSCNNLRRSDLRRRSRSKFWRCAFEILLQTGADAASGQDSSHRLS